MSTKSKTEKYYTVYDPKTGKYLSEYEFVDELVWSTDPTKASAFFDDMRIGRFYRHHTRLFDEQGCKFVPVTLVESKKVVATPELEKARTFFEAYNEHWQNDLKKD